MENDKVIQFINKIMDDNKNKEIEELFIPFLDDKLLTDFNTKIKDFVKDFQYNSNKLIISLDNWQLSILKASFSNMLKQHNLVDYIPSKVGFNNLLIMYCNRKNYHYSYCEEDSYESDLYFKSFNIKIHI